MIKIESLIRSANNLQPLPQTVDRLITLASKKNFSISEIEKTLTLDGVLSSRVLRMANSAAMGGLGEIGTIKGAVMRLGVGNILSLAIAASTKKQLDVSIPAYDLDQGCLWRHSQAAQLAANGITQYAGIEIPSEAKIAAMLHDIGKIVMAGHIKGDSREFFKRAKNGDASEFVAEKELFGIHHGELGGLIAQHWNLPTIIVRGIIYHHDPQHCEWEDNTICHIVAVANWIAAQAERCPELNDSTHPPNFSFQVVQLDNDSLHKITEQVRAQLQ